MRESISTIQIVKKHCKTSIAKQLFAFKYNDFIFSKCIIMVICISFCHALSGQNAFSTSWKTDNPGTSNNQSITIPTFLGETYNYNIDWDNDGIYDEFGITGDVTHDFGSPGTYVVKIAGTFPRIYFNNSGDKDKLLSVNQWGDIAWSSMEGAFWGCSNFNLSAADVPDLSQVKSLANMFRQCTMLNANLNNWNTSQIESTEGMFRSAATFNMPLGNWNISNVRSTKEMFRGASSFNQPLANWNLGRNLLFNNMFRDAISFNGDLQNWIINTNEPVNMTSLFYHAENFNKEIQNWDVSAVTDMSYLFEYAHAFNQPLESWNTGNITTMIEMFYRAEAFNQPLNGWDVSQVQDMEAMFEQATSFNQDISNWDVSSVLTMYNMFLAAESFNQPIGLWDTHAVETMSGMFQEATNFNQDISTWDVSNVSAFGFTYMFASATNFNQDISTWDISNAASLRHMFPKAISFDQNLASWDISNVTDMVNLFDSVSLSLKNYDAILISWSAKAVNQNVTFNAGISHYCLGESARMNLVNNLNWNIVDKGKLCNTIWLGSTNADWFNSGNWSNDVPSTGQETYIPIQGSAIYPVIDNNVAKCGKLHIQVNASLTITSTGSMIINN